MVIEMGYDTCVCVMYGLVSAGIRNNISVTYTDIKVGNRTNHCNI